MSRGFCVVSVLEQSGTVCAVFIFRQDQGHFYFEACRAVCSWSWLEWESGIKIFRRDSTGFLLYYSDFNLLIMNSLQTDCYDEKPMLSLYLIFCNLKISKIHSGKNKCCIHENAQFVYICALVCAWDEKIKRYSSGFGAAVCGRLTQSPFNLCNLSLLAPPPLAKHLYRISVPTFSGQLLYRGSLLYPLFAKEKRARKNKKRPEARNTSLGVNTPIE